MSVRPIGRRDGKRVLPGTRRRTRAREEGASEAGLYASLVASSDDAITAKTLDGIITTWNPAAERMYGYTAEEMIGKPVSLLSSPDRPDEMAEILDRIRAGERVDHYDTVRVTKGGVPILVSLTVSPIYDREERIVGASSIARDITEQRRAEERARGAGLYARSLIEASLDPFVTISPEGKITDVNEATVSATGVAREALVGTDFSDYFTEPERAREGYREAFEKGLVTDYPLTIRHRDGRRTEVLYNASVYRDAHGRVVGVFAAARDVTALKQASSYARSLIEASLDPFVTISPEGKITDVNEATVRATGVSREELVGTDFSDYFVEPEQAREGYRQVFEKGLVTDYPLTIRHRGGHLTEVLYNASVYRDAHGQVLGVFAAARDVTARKRVEAELARQRERELDRLAELERFQRLTVGRELKMIELKREIEELRGQLARAGARP